jgi:hypothetical protein
MLPGLLFKRNFVQWRGANVLYNSQQAYSISGFL